jgi:hypothetical protein
MHAVTAVLSASAGAEPDCGECAGIEGFGHGHHLSAGGNCPTIGVLVAAVGIYTDYVLMIASPAAAAVHPPVLQVVHPQLL